MPYYKRKKVRKSSKPKHGMSKPSNDIIMQNTKKSKNNIVPENNIKVVRGAKLKRKRNINIFISTAALICVICIIYIIAS